MGLRRIALLGGVWAGVLLASPAPRHAVVAPPSDAAAAAPLFLPGLLQSPPALPSGVSLWLDAPCVLV